MDCRACGTSNPAGTAYCINCGSPFADACAVCGAPRIENARFCGRCGTRLPDADPPPSPGPEAPPDTAPEDRGIERRLVSILFADLVSFTPYTETRDAEEVRETLDRYFELARSAIERHGGVIEKFIGDAVMAVWGAPTAREDDAERAVRAGLELVEAVATLGIQARAGILTGEAAVRVGVVGEGMVVGDTVNTAARLQAAATPGTVLVGEGTFRAASRAIAFEPAGDLALKGKAAGVAAWRAVRIIAERGGRNRSEALEAPFVGRVEELRLLKDLFHATEREARVRLVSVVGPAGIGKTRLASELMRYLDGLVDTVYWHFGRSPAYGQGISFWALGEMIRGRAGLVETDDERTTRAKVAEMLAHHVPEEAERRWIEPALLALLGIESRVASSELFAAWRTFFERLASQAPVVMVFEDHHHADAGLLDFVDHLLDWSHNVPIYVVTLARPELLERRTDWAAGKRNLTVIHLEPLPGPAMHELISGLVPGLPGEVVARIVHRAEGMPLYAVETIRMLMADGRLVAEDGTHRPAGDLSTLAVPETLTALISSRLDGLDPGDRALVADAAVLGQSFTPSALGAVSGRPEEELGPRLRTLVRLEILTLEADPRSPERGQYAFVQALIREVAYNTLARRDRRARHVAAARYFEGLGSDELAGALAGHYLAAHGYAPVGPEADALAAQARIALRAAADRAAALGSHEQAVAFLEQAISVTSNPVELADLLDQAGVEASYRQRIDQADALLRDALTRREAIGDRVPIARTMTLLGSILIRGFRFEAATAVLEDGAARFADMRDHPTVVALEGQLARVYMLESNWDASVAIADRVLEAAERAELIEIVADTLVTKGTALGNLGRHFEGIGLIEAGRRIAERYGYAWHVSRALNNLSSVLSDDDPRAGLEAARTGMEVAARLGQRPFTLIDNAATLAIRTGEWDWALGELEAAIPDETDPISRGMLLSGALQIRAFRGLDTSALIAEIEDLLDEDDPVMRAGLEWARATVAFGAGDLAAAPSHARRYAEDWPQASAEPWVMAARSQLWAADPGAEADLESLSRPNFHGQALDIDRLTIRAGLAALHGRTGESLTLYRDALRGWRDLGLPWDEALCAIDMATLLNPSEPEVAAAAETTRETLRRLGATPFLDRLDAAMSRSADSAPPPGSTVPAGSASVGHEPAAGAPLQR
ncbi:MAG TPA: adenylate/guanylate cyclase domain-containing protein [Candidatus Limnocylindria bacterium]|nr:adenylate/guanylate cyclase domain-containing protein [Candidatus Limnocylindria bacterium]